jgi:TolA-binding protein
VGKLIKIIAIAIPVLLIGGVVCAPQITTAMAKKCFSKENVDKPWAPEQAYRAGRINMKLFRFNAAASMLEKCHKTWPDASWQKDIIYQVALCHEKAGRAETAIKWYEKFLAKYPSHAWKDQALKRIENIKANML